MTNIEKMQELHETVAQTLISELGQDGELNPRVIELAIKFLHNNGVNVDMNATPTGNSIVSKLPFPAIPEEDAA